MYVARLICFVCVEVHVCIHKKRISTRVGSVESISALCLYSHAQLLQLQPSNWSRSCTRVLIFFLFSPLYFPHSSLPLCLSFVESFPKQHAQAQNHQPSPGIPMAPSTSQPSPHGTLQQVRHIQINIGLYPRATNFGSAAGPVITWVYWYTWCKQMLVPWQNTIMPCAHDVKKSRPTKRLSCFDFAQQ